MDASSPCLQGHFRACYWYHAQFTAGTGKCKTACCCYIVEDTGSIVGHTPLGLSRIVSSFLKRANHKATAEICEERVNRGAGLGLEIPVIYKIYCRRKYVD